MIQGQHKNSFGTCHIDYCWLVTLAEDCDAWYLNTKHVVPSFKDIHGATLKDKRLWRMYCNFQPWNINHTFSCSHCDRTCLSCIGLISRGLPPSLSSFYKVKPWFSFQGILNLLSPVYVKNQVTSNYLMEPVNDIKWGRTICCQIWLNWCECIAIEYAL